jgi:GntR family transcriptional regulator of arabinose operon
MFLEDIQPLALKDSKQPKYVQLADQIKSWIVKKRVSAGTKLPNNRQLAKLFKVTPVTINRSLQELARKGIVDLKIGSGTYVAFPDRKINKILQIGILCHDTFSQDDYYISTVLNAFHSFWKNYKSDLITLVKNSSEYRKAIEEYSLDGIMVLTPQKEFEPEITAIHTEHYPIVSIGTKFPSLKGCSFGTDHAHTACEAVKFLAEKGHKNIGIILSDAQCASIQERFEGYQQGMWESKLPINPDWIVKTESASKPFCQKKLEKILGSSEKVTAFIMVSHSHVIPFYSLMDKMGYKIPNDVSLLAFDDPLYTSQLNPPLTVYAQPIKQFTQKAAKSLLCQIRKEDFNDFEEDLPLLIERESTSNLLS